MRQVVLANDDLDVDAEIVLVAEDLDHAAARVLGRRRPVGDLDVHHQAFEVVPFTAMCFLAENAVALVLALARIASPAMFPRLGAFLAAGPLHAARDDDLLRDLLVDGSHVVVSRAVMKGADHRGIAAAEHAQDAAFGAAVFLLATEFDQHLVAVHGRADGLRADEDVTAEGAALPGIGDDEAITVAVHGQAPGDEILMGGSVLGEGVAVAPGFDQAPTFDQRLQSFGKLLPLVAAQGHLADQLLESGRTMRLAFDVAKDGGVSKHDQDATVYYSRTPRQ